MDVHSCNLSCSLFPADLEVKELPITSGSRPNKLVANDNNRLSGMTHHAGSTGTDELVLKRRPQRRDDDCIATKLVGSVQDLVVDRAMHHMKPD